MKLFKYLVIALIGGMILSSCEEDPVVEDFVDSVSITVEGTTR